MDPAAIATVFVGMQAQQLQAALAAEGTKMKLRQDAAIVQMLEAAATNSLTNVAAGIGRNLDVNA
ncbi:MAG TPA: hypothetical protein VM867_11085 [Xanthobacteraceae bacterium]|nr:hypothetical protein [Xanthobacteraceae bacterium]